MTMVVHSVKLLLFTNQLNDYIKQYEQGKLLKPIILIFLGAEKYDFGILCKSLTTIFTSISLNTTTATKFLNMPFTTGRTNNAIFKSFGG